MIFYKSVSAGNDFIHVESTAVAGSARADLARDLCERHTGAGADGVVFYNIRADGTGADFEIVNRDGSAAELSGNGMAGLSALLFHLRKFENRVVLHTQAGIKRHELMERKGNAFRLKIEIGEADFANKTFFPFLQEGNVHYEHQGIMFYPVSVGNPHVVVMLDKNLSHEEMTALGAKLESADIFPLKTNVELVLLDKSFDRTFSKVRPPGGPPEASRQVSHDNSMSKGRDEYPVFYYERGVGPTQSSSTGSAAVFAVLRKCGLIKDELTIATPLEKIKIFAKEKICVENFTKIVYKGKYLKL